MWGGVLVTCPAVLRSVACPGWVPGASVPGVGSGVAWVLVSTCGGPLGPFEKAQSAGTPRSTPPRASEESSSPSLPAASGYFRCRAGGAGGRRSTGLTQSQPTQNTLTAVLPLQLERLGRETEQTLQTETEVIQRLSTPHAGSSLWHTGRHVQLCWDPANGVSSFNPNPVPSLPP